MGFTISRGHLKRGKLMQQEPATFDINDYDIREVKPCLLFLNL